MNKKVSKQKTLIGKVVSNKPDKTIIVEIVRKVPHPLYKKTIKRSTKMHAHDEKNQCKIGDTVKIVESLPVSKTKVWRLLEVMREVQ